MTFAILLAAAAMSAPGETPIRNPFWAQGFEGRRYPITLTPRNAGEIPGAERPRAKNPWQARTGANGSRKTGSSEDALWEQVRATLTVNNICIYEKDGFSRQLVEINGRSYANGNLISVNSEGFRFTWQILGIDTNGVTRLKRLHRRELTAEELSKEGTADK